VVARTPLSVQGRRRVRWSRCARPWWWAWC